MSITCENLAEKIVNEAIAAGESLLDDEEYLMSDELYERLRIVVEDREFTIDDVCEIIKTAKFWYDAYAPFEDDPKDMLRALAYACLLGAAGQHVYQLTGRRVIR